MKSHYFYIILIIALVALHFLFPVTEPKIEIEYLPGDTTTIKKLQSEIDSLEYWYVAKLDSVSKVKPKFIKGKDTNTIDTVYIDTTILAYTSNFNFGTDTLGTSGRVYFDLTEFGFNNIEYRYPETIKTVVDTLKYTKIEHPGFYEDYWFWTAAVAVILLGLSLGSG